MTEKEGQGAAAAVRLAFNAADEKYRALQGLSARHRAVLSTMGREEESAVKAMVRASQLGEARKQQAFKETGFQYKAVLRENRTALQASLREGLRDYKAAKSQEIAAERQVTVDYKAELTERLAALRTELAAATKAEEAAAARQAGIVATMSARWRRGSQHIEHMGAQSAELATLLTHNVVAPLTLAGGAAVKFGIHATDSFDRAANSLGGLGVSITATGKLLNNLQQFAINSSFSLDDMNEFAPQYVRILTSHGTSPDKAAESSEKLIKAVANNAAKGGITDPAKLSRAMQQLTYIMDTDKLTLRNLKPFETATNLSMQQTATLFGYEDKGGVNLIKSPKQHWAKKGKKWVKDNGGQYIQDGFKDGKPNYVEDKGTKGKEQSAAAQLMADITASSAPSGKQFIEKLIESGGDIGDSAKRAQTATIAGRIQGMKESAERDLMGLFAERDEDGQFRVRRDPDSGMLTHVQTDLYKEVLKVLSGLTELWKTVLPGLKVAAKAFVDGLNRVVTIATDVAKFVADHPALQGFLKTLISFSVKALPLLIAFGVTAKILGKVGKLVGGLGSSAKSFGKALTGGAKGVTTLVRGTKHVGTGFVKRARGGRFSDGYRDSRARSRDAKEDGWGWSNRLRQERDNARLRWGAGKESTVRGYARAATQAGSGGLIDWNDRDRRRAARQRYQGERRALRSADHRQPQTAADWSRLIQSERRGRDNEARWADERRSGRQRDRDEYRARRASRPYVLDHRDEDEYAQRRRDRRATNRAAARDHLPAVPQTQKQRIEIEVDSAEKAIKSVDERLKLLAQEIKRINDVRLDHIRTEFDGSTVSVSHSAVKADEAIQHIKTLGVAALNTADLSPIQGRLAGVEGSVAHSAMKAETAVTQVKTRGLEPLNGLSLGHAQSELNGPEASVTHSAGAAERGVSNVRTALTQLNETASTAHVRNEFDGANGSLKQSVQEAKASVTRLATAIRNLKDINFDAIKRKLVGASSLRTAVNEVKNAVGVPSGTSGLNPALNKINRVSFRTAESRLKGLKDTVDKVTKATGALGAALAAVNKATGGDEKGGGGGKGKGGKGKGSKGRSLAPRGYVDYGVHASYGGGSIGPGASAGASSGTSGAMFAMASPSISSSASRGGGSGRGGFSKLFGGLDELRRLLDLTSLARTATAAVGLDKATTKLGSTGAGVRSWVGRKATWAGGQFSGLPDNLTDWLSKKLPPWLVKQPEGAPWTQLAGLAMGVAGPVVGQSFMDNVYHGHGNVVGRAKRMVGGVFSMDTLEAVFDNLTEMIKSLVDGVDALLDLAGRFVTDPGGVLGDLKAYASELFGGFIQMFSDSFSQLRSFLADPSEFAKEIAQDLLNGLKEALPNLDGLFDFSKGYARGGVVAGYSPGRDSVPSLLSPGESVLRPEITRLLGTDRVDGLNAAARGGNFKSLAEQIEEVWRTLIQPSFVAMSDEVRTDLSPTTTQYRTTSVDAWAAIGKSVQDAWQSSALPTMTAWTLQLRGDLTAADREFLASNGITWTQVSQQIDRSASTSRGSFSSLGSGLGDLESMFRSTASSIKSVWQSAMSYVDSATRSTISGPYNRGVVGMTSSMAGLAGSSAPLKALQFAHGGIVPGYSPGRDVVPAVLSPGEGVLRPEVVRALGHTTIQEWNRAARMGGNLFANGGIVKPLAWKGESGAGWVHAHQGDPYEGYADALSHGWSQNIEAMTKAVGDAFGTMGRLNGGVVDHFKGSVLEWGKYLDDHVGGASAAVKEAQKELGYTETGPNLVKYNQYNGEEWCADFISWVVDKAGANSSYWNSPQGTPANRWPSVATWNTEAAGSRISASQARAGDIVTYRNGGHIGLVESVANGVLHTIEGNVGPTVRRLTRGLSDPDHVFRARGAGIEGASFSGWPGAYASGVTIPDAGGLDGGTPAQNRAVAKQLLKQMGWSSQFGALDSIWSHESGWNQFAKNPDSGAYGVGQALPPSKMATAGNDWLTNAVTQIRWGLGYIKERYDDPERAWDFWQRHHWYAKGTRSASPGLALVGERGPELVEMRGGERVHTAAETASMLGGRPVTVTINAAPDVPTEQTIMRALERAHMMHGL
ncbi:CHAP domain-containing protein [Streptomyces sp. NPDC057654]|uniref:aggregation-promoting factor C-terminal-like domain-containing protein n=1 Tax=Streptomyces sp. NPDC057654 TaxID=3346196 RepID=UPI0036CAE34D